MVSLVKRRISTASDVHFSYAMCAVLPRTRAQTPVFHFTVSPIRNAITDPDDQSTLRCVLSGDYSVSSTLQWLRRTGILYRPDFVDEQLRLRTRTVTV